MPDDHVHGSYRMNRGAQEAADCILGADHPEQIVDMDKTSNRVRRVRDETG